MSGPIVYYQTKGAAGAENWLGVFFVFKLYCICLSVCPDVCQWQNLLIPSSSSSFFSTTSFSFIYPTVSSEIHSWNLLYDGLNFYNIRMNPHTLSLSSSFSSSTYFHSFILLYHPKFIDKLTLIKCWNFGIYLTYLWRIFSISLEYIRHIFGIPLAYLWYIFSISLL